MYVYYTNIYALVYALVCCSGEEYLSIPDHTAGSVQLHHGQISGLYTLRRKGEARMHSDSDGATIEAKLALQQVRLCYDFSAKVRIKILL